MAGFNSSLNTETDELLKLIECPVCLEVSHPPIYQCQLGHIVCCNCIPNIKECPICRQRMPDIHIRNIAVEKMTENITTKQCPNSKFGCKIRLKPGDNTIEVDGAGNHLRHCDYFSRDYCNRIGLGDLLGCPKTITKREISSHFKNDHMLNNLIVECSEAQVVQDIANILNTESRKWLPITLSVYNEHFFLVSEFTKISDGTQLGILWKCIAAAPVAITEEFIAKLTLTNAEKKLKLNWQGPVLSIDNMDYNPNYFSVPFETLKLFNAKKYENTEKLEWTIKVAIKESSTIGLPALTNSLASLNTISFATDENKKALFQFGTSGKEKKASGSSFNFQKPASTYIAPGRRGQSSSNKIESSNEHFPNLASFGKPPPSDVAAAEKSKPKPLTRSTLFDSLRSDTQQSGNKSESELDIPECRQS